MKRIMNFLLPKEKKFLDMLIEQSETALEASTKLKSFVDEYENIERNDRKQKSHSIKRISQKCEEIKNKIFDDLNKSSRTPIDKGDLRKLAILLGDISELVDDVASRFVILGIERIDSYTPKLVALVNNCIGEVYKTIKDLKRLKEVEEHYSSVHSLKGNADEVFNEALSDLFHFYKNSMDIMKNKEIYELLKEITEKCNKISYVISNIIAEHR